MYWFCSDSNFKKKKKKKKKKKNCYLINRGMNVLNKVCGLKIYIYIFREIVHKEILKIN